MRPDEIGCFVEMRVRPHASECSRIRRIVSFLAFHKLHNYAATYDLELAVGEAFSNAIKYGGGDNIFLVVNATSSRELVVEFYYKGESFDTAIEFPNDCLSGNGGFGRYIMSEVLDDIEYLFLDGYTRLRIVKRAFDY
ncbi:MAG: ATP-binding protein [Armatimonadetes bacterium]|nr:ATP-binding protein [Armatimonadota bacterium]